MPNFLGIASECFSGGISLIWTNNVDSNVNTLETHARFVHCQIRNNIKDCRWLVTF